VIFWDLNSSSLPSFDILSYAVDILSALDIMSSYVCESPHIYKLICE